MDDERSNQHESSEADDMEHEGGDAAELIEQERLEQFLPLNDENQVAEMWLQEQFRNPDTIVDHLDEDDCVAAQDERDEAEEPWEEAYYSMM